MTTVQNLIDVTRSRYLLGGMAEPRNKLAANYTAGATTLAFQYDLRNTLGAGSRLSIGLNTFYVWSVDTSANTAQVLGGDEGSTDANANTGAVVSISPRYTDHMIFNALNEDLADLSTPANGLFQVIRNTLIFNAALIGYDLAGATDIIDIIEIRHDENNSHKDTQRLDRSQWRLERNTAVADFPSTLSLKLQQGESGRNVNVLYKAPFTNFTTVGQNVSASGLPVSAEDIPPMGAALRLLAGKEVRRNQIESQGDTRRAEEVGAGSIAASPRGIMMLRQSRIMNEASRLTTAYPSRMR